MRRLLLAALLAVTLLAGAIGWWNQADESRRFEQARLRLNDGVVRAVILGDSVARGAGDERGLGIAGSLERQLRTLGVPVAAVANLGIDGARTFNVQRLLSGSVARRALRNADLVVVSIGGNDLYGDSLSRMLSGVVPGYQQSRTLSRIEQIVTRVQQENPVTRIYLLGLYDPYRHSALRGWLDRQINLWDGRLITRFAAVGNVTVVRICDLFNRDDRISTIDHFHPGARGYELIALRIASSI